MIILSYDDENDTNNYIDIFEELKKDKKKKDGVKNGIQIYWAK